MKRSEYPIPKMDKPLPRRRFRPILAVAIFCILHFVHCRMIFADTENVRFRLSIHSAVTTPDDYPLLSGINLSRSYSNEDLPFLLDNLLTAAKDNGYPLAQIDSLGLSRHKNATILDVYISEGLPLLGTVAVENSPLVPEPGDSGQNQVMISGASLYGVVNELLERMNSEGYPFATVTLHPRRISSAPDSLTFDVSLAVEDGGFKRISGLSFPGMRYSGSRILRLESRIKRANTFNIKLLENSVVRLQRLDYISRAGPAYPVASGPGMVDVIIPVTDLSSNRFSGMLALSPGDATPAGEVDIQIGNVLGSGRKLQFAWRGLSPHRKGISAAYREPWIFSFPIHAGVSLEQWSEDSLGVTTRRNVDIEWEPTFNGVIGVGLQFENIAPAVDSSDNYGSETIWIEGKAGLNYLDHDWNPTSGVKIMTATAAGFRKTVKTSSRNRSVRRDEVSVDIPRMIRPGNVLFLRAALKDIRGDNIAREELFSIGGNQNVRGYIEDRFRAPGFAWTNAEIRWVPGRDAYIGIFGDFGWIYRADARIQSAEKHLASIGFTAAFTTRAGILSIDAAWAKGKAARDIRLHFRIESRF